MQYFYSFCLIIPFVINANIATAQTSEGSVESSKYDLEFLQQYNQECTKTSMEEGLDALAAKKLCDCTISKFQQKYTQTEFVQLTTSSASDKQAENALIEVGQVCFEQTLYE